MQTGFLQTAANKLRRGTTGTWFFLSLVVGAAAGCGAIVFQTAGQCVSRFVLTEYTGLVPGEGDGERAMFARPDRDLSIPSLLVVMTLGGLASGVLVYTIAPEAEGHGTDGASDAFHNRRGNIPFHVAIVKTIASAITLGTAGSGGREGPIAQIGAAFGSFIGQRLNLSARDRRILLATGMGAGVGAIFRAPLAGALFAGEILYRDADLESDVIVPTAIASIVAYSLYGLFLPKDLCFAHIFGGLSEYSTESLLELAPYTFLAIALSLMARVYVSTFYGIHDLFQKLPGPKHVRPAFGAFLAGVLAIALFLACDSNAQLLAVLSTGYGTLQKGLARPLEVTTTVLLLVAFCKILTTSLTIGSGGSGGVFGPSMVIGGCTGLATGKLCDMAWPSLVNPGAFGVVGMAGFFAGCANAPISTIIMVCEMTGSYQLLLPAMWVSTLCFVMCHRVQLYRKQVPSRLDSPAHRGDFLVDVLEGIRVEDVYRKGQKVECVEEPTRLREVLQLLSRTQQHYFPVVNQKGQIVGIFSDDDVRRFIYDETIWELADACDIMTSPFVKVTPDEDLNSALKKFTLLNVDELPVVQSGDESLMLGMLRRKELISAYHQRLQSRKDEVAHHAT